MHTEPRRGWPPFDVLAIDNLDVVLRGLLSLQVTHSQLFRSLRTLEHLGDVDTSEEPPDVVVLDYWLGRDNEPSVESIAGLKAWGAKVLLYTTEESPAKLRAALREGVDGLCLKNDGLDALAKAIQQVGEDQRVFSGPLARAALDDASLGAILTDREAEVLRGLAYGLSNQEVADALVIQESTVKSHVEKIRAKYVGGDGEKVNRARLIHEAMRDGYLDPPARTSGSRE